MANCDIIILQIHPRCVYLGSVFMNTLIFLHFGHTSFAILHCFNHCVYSLLIVIWSYNCDCNEKISKDLIQLCLPPYNFSIIICVMLVNYFVLFLVYAVACGEDKLSYTYPKRSDLL